MQEIENKIYSINLYTHVDYIFIYNFKINPDYRGRHYSSRIFRRLMKKYNKGSIILECFPTLLNFYKKLGFEVLGETYDGYYEMILRDGN